MDVFLAKLFHMKLRKSYHLSTRIKPLQVQCKFRETRRLRRVVCAKSTNLLRTRPSPTCCAPPRAPPPRGSRNARRRTKPTLARTLLVTAWYIHEPRPKRAHTLDTNADARYLLSWNSSVSTTRRACSHRHLLHKHGGL